MSNRNPAVSPSDPLARRHRTFFVGLFLFVPLVLIPALIAYTLMKSEFFQGWCHLKTECEDSHGLTKGNQVSISGIQIGYVQRISLIKEGKVEVLFRVQRRYRHIIKKDTKVLISQKSFMVGDWQLILTGGSDSITSVNDGDTLKSECPPGIEKTIQQITEMVNTFELTLRGILSGKGSVGKVLTEDTLALMLQKIGSNLIALTEQSRGTIYGVDTLLASLTRTSEGGKELIDSLSIAVDRAKGALGDAQVIMKNLNGASSDLQPMVHQVQNDIEEAEMIMRSLQDSWLYKKFTGKPKNPVLKDNP